MEETLEEFLNRVVAKSMIQPWVEVGAKTAAGGRRNALLRAKKDRTPEGARPGMFPKLLEESYSAACTAIGLFGCVVQLA